MDTLLALLLGVGLAAATGFRLFVPFFVVSLAAGSGALALTPSFEWLASTEAKLVFGTASVLEVLAYFVPWVDNLLDAVATPAAVVAGTVLSAAVFTDMSPLLAWTLAILAGGGSAAVVQVASASVRTASSFATAGLGNPALATGELAGATGLSLLTIAVPALGAAVVGLFVLLVLRLRGSTSRRRRTA